MTLYKHGCIKMVDQITDQSCNAVIPTDYQFLKSVKAIENNDV